jgi:hypothetical protein
MSSRQTTTIAVLVTMRLPVGAHAADGINYVKEAVTKHILSAGVGNELPIKSLANDEIQVKLVRKETQYL